MNNQDKDRLGEVERQSEYLQQGIDLIVRHMVMHNDRMEKMQGLEKRLDRVTILLVVVIAAVFAALILSKI